MHACKVLSDKLKLTSFERLWPPCALLLLVNLVTKRSVALYIIEHALYGKSPLASNQNEGNE